MIQRDGMVLSGKPHVIIDEYGKRVRLRRIENLVGEAKREGLDAIPSPKFYLIALANCILLRSN